MSQRKGQTPPTSHKKIIFQRPKKGFIKSQRGSDVRHPNQRRRDSRFHDNAGGILESTTEGRADRHLSACGELQKDEFPHKITEQRIGWLSESRETKED